MTSNHKLQEMTRNYQERRNVLLKELKRLEQVYVSNNGKFEQNHNSQESNNTKQTHESKKSTQNPQWQKSAIMICDKFLDHKTGPLFTKIPTTPNYGKIIKSPISLEIVKQKIRSKVSFFSNYS